MSTRGTIAEARAERARIAMRRNGRLDALTGRPARYADPDYQRAYRAATSSAAELEPGLVAGPRFRPAVAVRWCRRKGHDWGDLEPVAGIRRRKVITLERVCQRCGAGELHTAVESVAGTNAKPDGW